MNCPICGTPVERTEERVGNSTTVIIRCPNCVARAPLPAWELLTGRREIREYVNGQTSPEQLRELIDSTPPTVAALQFALSALWVHHCAVVRLLIPTGGEPGVLARMAELRHDLATQMRAMFGEGVPL